MSDEIEETELDEPITPVNDESERFAVATYMSREAELAQAYGNALAQAIMLPYNSPFVPVTVRMLEKIVDSIETAPKGSVRALKGGKD
jgi:hypothetical protein